MYEIEIGLLPDLAPRLKQCHGREAGIKRYEKLEGAPLSGKAYPEIGPGKPLFSFLMHRDLHIRPSRGDFGSNFQCFRVPGRHASPLIAHRSKASQTA